MRPGTGLPIRALRDFLKAARGQPTNEVLKEFLRFLVKESSVSESGSLHLNDRDNRRLLLFNPDNFLFNEGFLSEGDPWQAEFQYNQGVAGKAFRTKIIQQVDKVEEEPEYSTTAGEVPIANLVCAPILLRGDEEPFAVASFHNSTHENVFDEEKKYFIEVYIDALELVLEAEMPRRESTEIFVVHGHDEAAREAVVGFMKELGLAPITLREEPNEGQTIIEKLEQHRGSGYAVVLLTPDDRGGSADSGVDQLKPRARQNVVFELGFFVGALGRGRVCTLHKPRVENPIEFPSDVSGVVYIPMDDEHGWKIPLASELHRARFEVDLNKLLRGGPMV